MKFLWIKFNCSNSVLAQECVAVKLEINNFINTH